VAHPDDFIVMVLDDASSHKADRRWPSPESGLPRLCSNQVKNTQPYGVAMDFSLDLTAN
jgi:hypothetical protein